MNPTLRKATQLPLTCLWRDDGELAASRGRLLSGDDVRDLLRHGPIQFVVAACAEPLRWVPVLECFDFWMEEVQTHLADPESQASLEEFPGGYCYFASEW